jgi:hypothetical protein
MKFILISIHKTYYNNQDTLILNSFIINLKAFVKLKLLF